MENKIVADQAIFGWVDWKGRSGFQFITSSSSLEQLDYDYLSKYSLPANALGVKITSCRRLFVLPSGKIAMNYVKNIGKDSHGRDGALFSHFLIMGRDAFIQVKRNLSIADVHHLRGIESLNDLRKLILPDGNSMKLPQVIIELSEGNQSPLNKFLIEGENHFISDLLYAIFLNIFQSDIKINLLGTDESEVFDHMSLIESMFPSWMIIPFSTYRYTGEAMDPFVVMCHTDSSLLDPEHVLVDFKSKSVSVPGEDNFIRMVSSEYVNLLMKDSNLSQLESIYNQNGSTTPQFFLIQYIIMSICNGPDKEQGMKVSLMVSAMGLYGERSVYNEIISKILADTHYSLDSVQMLIDSVSDMEKSDWTEGGPLYDYVKILLRVEPGSQGEEAVIKFLINLIKEKGSQTTNVIFSMIMDDGVSPEIASSIVELIPNVQRLYGSYIEKHSITEAFLQRSISIFGEFREMGDTLLRGFEMFFSGGEVIDQSTVVRVLKILEDHVNLFDQRGLNKLLRNLQKTIKKQKVPVRSEIEDSIGHLKDAETKDAKSEN